jgi:hypothetical protein
MKYITTSYALEKLKSLKGLEARDVLYALGVCYVCEGLLSHHGDEPFASCKCGTGEDTWNGKGFIVENLVSEAREYMGNIETPIIDAREESPLVVIRCAILDPNPAGATHAEIITWGDALTRFTIKDDDTSMVNTMETSDIAHINPTCCRASLMVFKRYSDAVLRRRFHVVTNVDEMVVVHNLKEHKTISLLDIQREFPELMADHEQRILALCADELMFAIADGEGYILIRTV